ncbi:MAG TPA: hypothetical protein VJN01_03285 [Xanthomonadales bacterium]|nr:hypothetical protein [Xanthomonadales bacterium]
MVIPARKNRNGGSLVGNIFLLALFAYGVFLAFQYVPQFIESRSLDSVLESIETQHRGQPYESAQQVEQAIKNLLNLNQMDDMIKNIRVREDGNSIYVEVSYKRELDLLFQKKVLNINKTVDLD